MGLSLKYVVLTNAGTWHYRRRVPKAARTTFPQSEFKRLLGDSQREALRNWPHVHAEFERLTSNHAAQQRPSPRTTNQLHSMDVSTDSHSEVIASTPPLEAAKNSYHIAKALKPTLADAKQLYLQERIIGDINERHKTARIERVMAHLHAVIAPDCLLSDLTRSHAREVRDRMLNELEMTPITVKRYLCDVSAMVNLGLREFDIRDAINPFLNLPIKIDTVAREERDPLPEEVLQFMRERLTVHAAPDIFNIWQIVEGTGCRLGEVTGLLKSDVHTDEAIPYIDLVFHDHRRLKTNGSIRRVPLVGDALIAVNNALKEAGDSTFLFPRYGRVRGADSASAALMKHLRAVSDNPKHTVHSLRHGMEDKLTRAGLSEFDRNLVLGHSSGGMSERYGGAEVRLEMAHKALLRISSK
ncbi:tyrosine-type recombinase/integrase [Ochrobactrum sp. MR34]|nr:tyrosine-type recombinase/integrase [Ochrobactrum sp. MR34]